MLNEVNSPPPTQNGDVPVARSTPRLAADVHVDPQEPGIHKARIFGEKTHINPEYAMPLEDRGSTFSIGLTIAGGLVVVAVLVCVYVAIR